MRILTELDRRIIISYIKKEPELNLMISSAIEKYGVNSENVHIYAAGDREEWDCLLVQYYDDYMIYSQQEELPFLELAQFLGKRQVDCIRGKIAHIKPLRTFYPNCILKENNLCCYKRKEWETSQLRRRSLADNKIRITRLYAEDSAAMMEVYLSAEEFARTFQYPEKSERKIRMELEDGELAVGVYENGRLVSVARTSGSDCSGTMIVCVATNPVCRGKGYSTQAVQVLCDKAFEAGKQFLCLYYSNPTAGRIYEKIGFQVIGDYAMLR